MGCPTVLYKSCRPTRTSRERESALLLQVKRFSPQAFDHSNYDTNFGGCGAPPWSLSKESNVHDRQRGGRRKRVETLLSLAAGQ
eukprot:scaffold18143_cov49-Attheya_sp.AAC.1